MSLTLSSVHSSKPGHEAFFWTLEIQQRTKQTKISLDTCGHAIFCYWDVLVPTYIKVHAVVSRYGRTLTPSENTQTVNHGGVRVCAHKAVWVEISILIKYHSCQILQIHLVDDSWARGNNSHVVKSLGTPLGLKNGKNTMNAWHTPMYLPLIPTDIKNELLEPNSAIPLKIQIVLYFFQIPGLDSSVNCLPCQEKKTECINFKA